MSKKLPVCVCLALLGTLLGSPGYILAQVRRITKANLNEFGWQPLPKIPRGEWPGVAGRLISVDQNGRVLAGFTVRSNNGLATREHPGLSFHILRFTSERTVDISLALPTRDYFTNALYLGPQGQVLARVNEMLQISGPDLTSNPDWQTLASCPRDCQLSQSPSHNTMVIIQVSGPSYNPHVYAHALLDLSSSPPRLAQDCPQSGGTITDKFNYGQASTGAQYFAWRWPLCEPERKIELPLDLAGGSLHPLNDELLLVVGKGKRRDHDLVEPLRRIELVTVDGKLKFQREMAKHEVVAEEVRSDERGDRFAVLVETWRGGSRLLDISSGLIGRRVIVYSTTGQELASISTSTTYHRDFDFSLSPDGHQLAILDEGVVTIADLE